MHELLYSSDFRKFYAFIFTKMKIGAGEKCGKIMAYMDMGVSIEEIAGKLHVTIGEVKQIAASMR